MRIYVTSKQSKEKISPESKEHSRKVKLVVVKYSQIQEPVFYISDLQIRLYRRFCGVRYTNLSNEYSTLFNKHSNTFFYQSRRLHRNFTVLHSQHIRYIYTYQITAPKQNKNVKRLKIPSHRKGY